MRDEFRKDVKDVLAARVGHRCSNPACGAVTSGPAQRSDKAVNVGVAAHITAAAVGGPRYDPTLTSQQRSAASNGIWLCQTDAKLVDADPVQYTVAHLRQWKADAEARTEQMLSSGLGSIGVSLTLMIPSLDTVDSLLSFANTGVSYVGREKELDELKGFLAAETPFSWWLWTGPAGVGKSRLAVELCREASGSWHAGFLREAHQSRLGDLQPAHPTLVVVDYASQRSVWLSEAFAQLSQRKLGSKVRVLILERQASGPWWETTRRQDRMEESAKVDSTMYALPRRLHGLDRNDVRVLIRGTAEQLGHGNLTPTHIEDIADRADRIDPDGRPLFIQVATMDWLHKNVGGGSRDDALRRLIARSTSQLNKRIGSSSLAMLARNVQVFTTALGGLNIEDYADLSRTPPLPANILPNVFQVLGSVTLDELIDGMRPDIVGELFVLDQLNTHGTTRFATTTLLHHAFHSNPDAYQGFVERATADHTEHPRLLDLLIASISDESSAVSAELSVAVIPLLKRSDHPAVTWIFDQLASFHDHLNLGRIGQLLATARFQFANLVFGEGNMNKAFELLTQALQQCNPAWPQYGNILNNRGITLLELGQPKAAIADFSAVIDAAAASNEARACALNNRADVLFSDGDVAGAIADRSAVLALTDTTYNRRYIALARRAVALRRLGDKAGAYQDIETILATSDIAVEQKMAARLMRAEWLLEDGDTTEAQPDLNCIVASYRNFDDVEQKARELRTPQAVNG